MTSLWAVLLLLTIGGSAVRSWENPGPETAGDPTGLDLRQLGDWLARHLAAGTGPPAPRLRALLDHWHLAPAIDSARFGPAGIESPLPVVVVAEADVDGDGRKDLVTALHVSACDGCFPQEPAVYVLRRSGAGYRPLLVRPPTTRGELTNLAITAVADLTGDGRPEIIAFGSECGAHTCTVNVVVVRWKHGELETLPGIASISSPRRVTVRGAELVLQGGTVNSVGAGRPRDRVDRYRVKNGELRLVGSRFDPSEFAYDRLVDGIQAETFGRIDEALRDYRDAADPARTALAPDDALCSGRETSADDATADAFTDALRSFARFRRGALLMQQGQSTAARETLERDRGPYVGLGRTLLDAGSRDAGCAAAAAWARDTPAFLADLNRRCGYAKPWWRARPTDLCGPLPHSYELGDPPH